MYSLLWNSNPLVNGFANSNLSGSPVWGCPIFFGLPMRQFVCAVLAVGVAVGLYFGMSRIADRETVSWVCIVGAAPIAAAGFFHYNGLTLEKFLWAWFKSEFLMAGNRVWRSENYYMDAVQSEVKKRK